MLAQTVQVGVLREVRLEVDILALEHQLVARGVEEDLARVGAGHGEGEGVGVILEKEVRVLGRAPLAEARTREDLVGHLVDGVIGVQDLNVQPVVGLVLDL